MITWRSAPRGGFTLIELISVVAIIAILAAILIPSVASVRTSANKAKARMQYSQWAAAIEAFRNEYGCYPSFDRSQLVNGGAGSSEHLFHDVLSGRHRDGTTLAATSSAAMQNPKRIAFFTFPESDFVESNTTAHGLVDALGNTEIAVIVDRNLDGAITLADCGGDLPMISGARPELPSGGVHAGVGFYSAAPASTADRPEFVLSWK